jgi:hypothetical protein
MQINVHYTGDPRRTSRVAALLMRRRFRVMCCVGALEVLLAVGGGAVGAPVPDAVFMGVIGVLMIAVPLPMRWLIMRLKRKAIMVDVDVEVTDQGISRRTAARQVQLQWERLREIIETSEFWIFVVDRRHFVALSKSVLTPDQQAEIADFLAQSRLDRLPGSSKYAGRG